MTNAEEYSMGLRRWRQELSCGHTVTVSTVLGDSYNLAAQFRAEPELWAIVPCYDCRDADPEDDMHFVKVMSTTEIPIGEWMTEPPLVAMLDHADLMLHRCGDVNLTTACGHRLNVLTVARTERVAQWAWRICAECWTGYDAPEPGCLPYDYDKEGHGGS